MPKAKPQVAVDVHPFEQIDATDPALVTGAILGTAVEHGLSNGDMMYAIGDIEIAFLAAVTRLTAQQRTEMLSELADSFDAIDFRPNVAAVTG